MSGTGTKRNCLGAHGISGAEGRPAVPSTWRRQPALDPSRVETLETVISAQQRNLSCASTNPLELSLRHNGRSSGSRSLSGLAAAVAWSIPSLIAPRGGTATIGGIMNLLNNMIGVVAPITTGYIVGAQHSFTGAFLLPASWPVFGSPGGGSRNCRYNRSAKRRASAPTRTQVRGKGAIAIAAQMTTENKLKVTAIEIRPAKRR
jgi:hypothetical protein